MSDRQYRQRALEVRSGVATLHSRLIAHAVWIALLFVAIIVCLALFFTLSTPPPIQVPASSTIAGMSRIDMALQEDSGVMPSGDPLIAGLKQMPVTNVDCAGLTCVLPLALSLAVLVLACCGASLISVLSAFKRVSDSTAWAEKSLLVAQQRFETLREQYERRLNYARRDERKRLAEELHDSTQQHLVAIDLYLMQVGRLVAPSSMASTLLGNAVTSVNAAQRELRAFSYSLFPTELTDAGLAASIKSFAEGFAARTGLTGQVAIGAHVDDIPLSAQQGLLRVIQEALLNVHRHAHATAFRVTLERTKRKVVAVVQDNGSGFEQSAPESVAGRGIGIASMRSRLRALGGELIVSSSEAGTQICATVSLPEGRSQAAGRLAGYAKAV